TAWSPRPRRPGPARPGPASRRERRVLHSDPPSRSYSPSRTPRLRERGLGPGSVRELAELARHEVGGLLADVDRVVADPLQAARDEEHAQAPLVRDRVPGQLEDAVDGAAVDAVDQLVELDERRRRLDVALGERLERHADHLLAAVTHLLEPLDQRRPPGNAL